MAIAPPEPRSLPRSIRRGLRRVDRRLRVVALVRGLGIVALVLAIGAVLGMVADLMFVLPDGARWAIWLAWLASAGVALAWTVVRPLVRRVAWMDLAALVERAHPTLHERLTSTVGLLRGPAHGSPELIDALAVEAADRAEGLNLGLVLSLRTAFKRFALGVSTLALVLLPGVVGPEPLANLVTRFVAPWLDVERVGRFLLDVRPGDRIVAVGSDVTITATVRPRFGSGNAPEDAWLHWTDALGKNRSVRMTAESVDAASTRRFTITLPRVADSFGYRVASGSARSRSHRIKAIEPPAVVSLSATITPPAYTHLPESNANDPARIVAWEGSRIRLDLTTNRPVIIAEITWPAVAVDDAPAASRSVPIPESSDLTRRSITLDASAPGLYAFALKDEYDLSNSEGPPRRLIVRPDLPPTVALDGSDEPRDARPDDVLLLDVAARDDLAVASAELHYAVARAGSEAEAEPGHVKAPLKGVGTRSAQGEAALSLKGLNLQPGDVITYRVRVTDSRPNPRGPNVTWSTIRSLTIAAKAEPLSVARGAAERLDLQAKLNEIKKAALENRKETEALRYLADAAQGGNGPWDKARDQALRQRETAARDVADKLQLLARDFAASSRFAPLERPARQIAEVEAESGRESLEQARQAPDPARRLDDLKQADHRLTAVTTRLDDLQRKFDALARADDDLDRLRVLAERQDDVAARAQELAKTGNHDQLDRVRQEQEQLRKETEELVKRSPDLRAQALADQARRADDLARLARDLARRQLDESRQAADLSDREKSLKTLADAQRQLEDDARRLALLVDPPLQENGRSRLNVDTLAQAADPIERGDVNQGRDRLEASENELRRLARDLDDVRDDPKALARRLARRQDELRKQTKTLLTAAKTPEEKAGLAARLKPLAAQQGAIAKLAAAIPADEPQKHLVNDAARTTNLALDDLNTPHPDQVQGHQNEAFNALNRLASTLPDPNQRRQATQKQLNEVRRKADAISRDLDRQLRETAPKPNQAPEIAARALAQRVIPIAARAEELAADLTALNVEDRAQPQAQRAVRRAQNLAGTLDALRDAAPTLLDTPDAKPADAWHLLGPFDLNTAVPFSVANPIDLKAIYQARDNVHATWRREQPGDRGLIDLGQIYSRDGGQVAFGYAEIKSPADGFGSLVVGSDDTLTVWLNEKQVYDFQGNRSFNPDQAKVETRWVEGVNRLVVRCGNASDDWKFSVAARPPATGQLAQALEHVQRLRDRLPIAQLEARAALDRLDQKHQGRVPADDLAADLADDLHDLKSKPPVDPAEAAAETRRIANALRNLDAPDAPLPRAEAVRLADRAARTLADPQGDDPTPAVKAASEAAETLVRRLTDEETPAQQAEALARAQRALNEPDAPHNPADQAQAQRAIADDLKRLPDAGQEQAHLDAVQQVEHAVALADQAAKPNGPKGEHPPDPKTLAAVRDQAAHALDALARGHEPAPEPQQRPGPNPPPPVQARQLAEAQRALANDLQAVRNPAPNKDQNPDVAQAKLNEQLKPFAQRQHELAEAARALPNPQPTDPNQRNEAGRRRAEARQAQRLAADAMAQADPARAADQARKAAEALDHLAAVLPDQADPPTPFPDDPDLGLGPNQADAARALARRERQIKERLQSLLAERIAPQDQLRDQAAELGRRMADLRDQARDLSPRTQGAANAAADLLQNQAPQAMGQGADALAQGRPDAALAAQRRAADLAENAARQAGDLAAALRADRPAGSEPEAQEGEGDGDGQNTPGRLASAQDAQREAARRLEQVGVSDPDGQAAQGASTAMHQAAADLRAAAQAARGPSSPSEAANGPPQTASLDPNGAPAASGEPDLGELQALVRSKTGRAWGELPGHLRTEILQMSRGRYRDDYARLIQLYFREIAADRAGNSDRGMQP